MAHNTQLQLSDVRQFLSGGDFTTTIATLYLVVNCLPRFYPTSGDQKISLGLTVLAKILSCF